MAGELAVWLYGDCVALIDQERGRPRLTYTPTALERYPLGTPLLSLALPVRPERYPQGLVRPFLDGLLPEGQARLAIADDFYLPSRDTFGLIRAIGRDCAGAIVIQPVEDPPPPSPPTTLSAEPLTSDDIELLVQNLRTAPLGVDERVRLSLGGVQEKLLLTRMPNGSWGRPVDGTPSTHIIKPEIARFPGTVENEAFCMRIAKNMGVNVAEVDVISVGARRLLAITRFDRNIHADGAVERVHQEDFCQAYGILPDHKYQRDGGPSLRRIAQTIASVATTDSVVDLARSVVVNALVGNGDAHGKNFSLVHDPTGSLHLAPLYDVVCTLHYRDDELAMYIDNVHRTDRVTAARLINEVTSWDVRRADAEQIIGELLDKSADAISLAHEQTEGIEPEIVARVERQRKQLLS
ncbi:MAG: HipA domain-containing protein [Acidimicrobiales bacterium]